MRILRRVVTTSVTVVLAFANVQPVRAQPAAPAAAPAAPVAAPKPVEKTPADPPLQGTSTGEDAQFGARTLHGHTFQTPILLDTAFVTTYVGVATELGVYSQPGVSVTALDTSGVSRVFTYDRSLGFIQQRVAVGFAPFTHFGMDVDASYTALVGGNDEAIFLFGGTTSYDVRPGVRARAFRSKTSGTQIGVRAYAIIDGGVRLRPSALLEEVAKQIKTIAGDPAKARCLAAGDFSCVFNGAFDALSAMELRRTQVGAGASVSVAQPFGQRFGLQGSLGTEVAAAHEKSANTGDVPSTPLTFYAGVAPSLNLYPLAPLGLMVEYRFQVIHEDYGLATPAAGTTATAAQTSTGSSTSVQHGVAAGLYYTGRRDLQLGVAFTGNILSTSLTLGAVSFPEPTTSVLTGRFTLRYFF